MFQKNKFLNLWVAITVTIFTFSKSEVRKGVQEKRIIMEVK